MSWKGASFEPRCKSIGSGKVRETAPAFTAVDEVPAPRLRGSTVPKSAAPVVALESHEHSVLSRMAFGPTTVLKTVELSAHRRELSPTFPEF
jgi:hypothetical protein